MSLLLKRIALAAFFFLVFPLVCILFVAMLLPIVVFFWLACFIAILFSSDSSFEDMINKL